MSTHPEHLEQTRLGILPNPMKLAWGLLRPSQRFVMINAIVFKERSTGDYAHLSGREAYELYAQSVQKAQGLLGAWLLWSGQVTEKMTSGHAPNFHAIAFLEYASPQAFLQFVIKGGSAFRRPGPSPGRRRATQPFRRNAKRSAAPLIGWPKER